jgi:hypothetical protein
VNGEFTKIKKIEGLTRILGAMAGLTHTEAGLNFL